MPPSHGGSRRFESCCAHHRINYLAGLAVRPEAICTSVGLNCAGCTDSGLSCLLRCCRRREHCVNRSYHVLHTLRKFLHVLVRRRVRARVSQVRLNLLYGTQLLCSSGNSSPEYLELQYGRSNASRKGFKTLYRKFAASRNPPSAFGNIASGYESGHSSVVRRK